MDNLISVDFPTQEVADLLAALTTIETIMRNKTINLTPTQRQQYGRVRYEIADSA